MPSWNWLVAQGGTSGVQLSQMVIALLEERETRFDSQRNAWHPLQSPKVQSVSCGMSVEDIRAVSKCEGTNKCHHTLREEPALLAP